MKTFLQFVTETPALLDTVEKNDYLQNLYPFSVSKKTKIGQLDNEHFIHQENADRNSRMYMIRHFSSNKNQGIITGHMRKDGIFQIGYTTKLPKAKFKMKNVYAHLVLHHHSIISDIEQSPGSKKIWQSLVENPLINVRIIRTNENNHELSEPINLKQFEDSYDEKNPRLTRFLARKK